MILNRYLKTEKYSFGCLRSPMAITRSITLVLAIFAICLQPYMITNHTLARHMYAGVYTLLAHIQQNPKVNVAVAALSTTSPLPQPAVKSFSFSTSSLASYTLGSSRTTFSHQCCSTTRKAKTLCSSFLP